MHRSARSRIRTHMGIFIVWESGDACGGWKRGPYVEQWRAPLARGSAGGDTYILYTPLSLSDTFFASCRIFLAWRLPAYARMMRRPLPQLAPTSSLLPPMVRFVRSLAFVTRRHVEREGFYFKYFRFRWALSMNETVQSITLKLSSDVVSCSICLCRMICQVFYR